jgi:coiled-coil domain-containing protein 130
MKCHLCNNWMEIRTDPKNSEYVVVEGAKRKMEDRSAEELGVKAPLGKEEAELMQNNPFFRLEHRVADEKVAQVMVPKLGAIQTVNERTWKNDYEASRLVRRKFREEKKLINDEKGKVDALKSKLSIDLPIQRERDEDVTMARNLGSERKKTESLAHAAKRIKNDSIFGKNRKKLSFGDEDLEEGNFVEKLDFAKRKRN